MGYCKNILMVLPLCLLLNEPQVVGQRQPPPGGTTIAVDAPLVLLRAAVRDRKGGLVSGLNKDNFQVFEDRAPQTIRFVEHEDVPVAVGLVVDNSASMGRKRKGVIAAALAFARSSNPQDEMFVVNFNEHVSFGLPDTALFSARPDDLERALNGIPASGRTALYDAIEAGLSHLRKATLGKKALIVISDGGDNASHNKLGQLLEAASRADVMIYTVGIFDEGELHVSRWFSLDEYHVGHPGVLKRSPMPL